jgi:hypothetical protein
MSAVAFATSSGSIDGSAREKPKRDTVNERRFKEIRRQGQRKERESVCVWRGEGRTARAHLFPFWSPSTPSSLWTSTLVRLTSAAPLGTSRHTERPPKPLSSSGLTAALPLSISPRFAPSTARDFLSSRPSCPSDPDPLLSRHHPRSLSIL